MTIISVIRNLFSHGNKGISEIGNTIKKPIIETSTKIGEKLVRSPKADCVVLENVKPVIKTESIIEEITPSKIEEPPIEETKLTTTLKLEEISDTEKYLSMLKNKDLKPSFSKNDIILIEYFMKEGQEGFLRNITKLKDKNGNRLLNSDDVITLLSSCREPKKIELIENLLKMIKEKVPRFTKDEIIDLAANANNPVQKESLEKLVKAVNKDGKNVFNAEYINHVMPMIETPEHAVLAENPIFYQTFGIPWKGNVGPVEHSIMLANEKGKGQLLSDLAGKLINDVKDSKDHPIFKYGRGHKLMQILELANTPKDSEKLYDLSKNLMKIEDKNGNSILKKGDYLSNIVSTAKTSEEVEQIYNVANNKTLIENVSNLDEEIRDVVYANAIISRNKELDSKRINKLFADLKNHYNNPEKFDSEDFPTHNHHLPTFFDKRMSDVTHLLDDETILYAANNKTFGNFKKWIKDISETRDNITPKNQI